MKKTIKYRGLLYKEAHTDSKEESPAPTLPQRWERLQNFLDNRDNYVNNAWESGLVTQSGTKLSPAIMKKMRCQISSAKSYLLKLTSDAEYTVHSVQSFLEAVERGEVQ